MHRNLAAFARWFLSQPPTAWRAPPCATYEFDAQGSKVSSVILHRDGRYQAELFMGTQSGMFPEHAHPNVDSIEVMIAGRIEFMIRGRPAFSGEVFAKNGMVIGVGAGVAHGAIVHNGGGAFLSLQRWREGVPVTSVGIDWDGPAHHGVRGGSS